MEWVPIVFIIFKAVALGTGMFFAIKWHYDQGKKDRRTSLRVGGTIAVIFILSLAGVGLVALTLSRMLGLDLG